LDLERGLALQVLKELLSWWSWIWGQ
jgi:hypothetical protein